MERIERDRICMRKKREIRTNDKRGKERIGEEKRNVKGEGRDWNKHAKGVVDSKRKENNRMDRRQQSK